MDETPYLGCLATEIGQSPNIIRLHTRKNLSHLQLCVDDLVWSKSEIATQLNLWEIKKMTVMICGH